MVKTSTPQLQANKITASMEQVARALRKVYGCLVYGNLMFTNLPNLTNNVNQNLKTLFVHHTKLEELPEDFCYNCPEITIV